MKSQFSKEHLIVLFRIHALVKSDNANEIIKTANVLTKHAGLSRYFERSLPLFDLYYAAGFYEQCREILMKLKPQFENDAYFLSLQAKSYQGERSWVEAQLFVQAAQEADEGYEPALKLSIMIGLAAADYEKVATGLLKLKRNFAVDLDPETMVRDPLFKEFVNSEDFKKIRERFNYTLDE